MELSEYFTSSRGAVTFLIWGVVLIAVSGIFFGMLYYFLDITHTALLSTDCVINNNAFFDSCQDMWELAVYPFLGLKTVLVYLSFFFIFILVLGMLLSGYNSGTKPYMLGVLLVLEIAITYGSLWISNIYRALLDNEIIRTAMINFSVYNKIMLNFPWFVFVVSLFSLAIGIVNWQRVRKNTPVGDLDY